MVEDKLKEQLSKAREALLKIAELTPDQQAYYSTETIKQIAIRGLMT